MPRAPRRACRATGCPKLAEDGEIYCREHLKEHRAKMETRSASSRGYGSKWQKARASFLKTHPLCAECARKTPPKFEKATVVDHIKPHKGDQKLFWDTDNWQPLCKRCHDQKTGREDRQTFYHY